MSDITLTKTLLRGGVWEGVLTCDASAERPEILVTHVDRPLDEVTVDPVPDEPGSYLVRIVIGPEVLTDGVQTVVVSEAASGARLGSIAFVAGEALEDDVRAEIQLLRAELDMLKRAFRRHCVETSSH